MKDFKELYKLSKIDLLGSVRISKLINTFGSAEKVLDASMDELRNIDGINKTIARSLLGRKLDFNNIEIEYEALLNKLDKFKAGIITIEDKEYPQLLKKIYDPPVFLYYKGDYQKHFEEGRFNNFIAIVGTRRPSEYGKMAARKFASELAQMGISIISGLARGIDTTAHNASLECRNNDSISVGVLGCGVDVIYPPENIKLYGKICNSGVMLSEYEIGAKPDAVNFPRRNRIISGMSLGVIIIETGKEGGAMITARYALDQSREVFAVPGNINSKFSEGTNELIKNGYAKLVSNTNDVLVELETKLKKIKHKAVLEKEPVKINLKDKEMIIYKYLSDFEEPIDIDTISVNSGLTISDSLVSLLNLEFKGIVKQLPGKRFILN